MTSYLPFVYMRQDLIVPILPPRVKVTPKGLAHQK